MFPFLLVSLKIDEGVLENLTKCIPDLEVPLISQDGPGQQWESGVGDGVKQTGEENDPGSELSSMKLC